MESAADDDSWSIIIPMVAAIVLPLQATNGCYCWPVRSARSKMVPKQKKNHPAEGVGGALPLCVQKVISSQGLSMVTTEVGHAIAK